LWEGVEYPGDKIVERKDFAEYLAEVKHTQLRTRQIAHHNNQQVRQEYKDKYDAANKVVYPKYVAGDQVWVKFKDKNQRSANPKLAPIWEQGTIVKRGVTGTSYRVDRPGRKRKKVITVNVQQLKPYRVQEERTEIARPPPVPPGEDEQQQSTDEQESEGEEEESDMPEVDLGSEEEESKEADPHFLDTMRERLAVLKDTPLPQQDTPLPGKQTPLPRDNPPLPDTPPQSEGMLTRAQKRAGGGKIRHVPITRAARQQVHLARPPPPACKSTGQTQQQQALEDEDKLMQRRGQLRAHAEDEDEEDGPSEKKRVFNRRKGREHDADWEEPLLKRIKHLREITMRAKAARAGKRLKHAVAALSVVGTVAGRRDLHRGLASMTEIELLAALAADNFELIL
jgi:hypothetical protein